MHQGETVNPFDNGASCFTGSKNENGEAAVFCALLSFQKQRTAATILHQASVSLRWWKIP